MSTAIQPSTENPDVLADPAVARRLLTLGEEKFGAPPVPYSFVVLGSQGRREMGMASDQDNAFIIDDAYDEAAHGDYFARLADFVCNSLAECGYPLCPGNMMASVSYTHLTLPTICSV